MDNNQRYGTPEEDDGPEPTEEELRQTLKELQVQDEDHFTLRDILMLRLLPLPGVLLFGALFVIGLGDNYRGWDIFTNMDLSVTALFGILTAGCAAAFLHLSVRRVRVEGESITYFNLFGIPHRYFAADIVRVQERRGLSKDDRSLVVYGRNGRLFSVSESCPQIFYFVYWLRQRNIEPAFLKQQPR